MGSKRFSAEVGERAVRMVIEHQAELWVADFAYVASWSGFVFVDFVIDVFARMIVRWQ